MIISKPQAQLLNPVNAKIFVQRYRLDTDICLTETEEFGFATVTVRLSFNGQVSFVVDSDYEMTGLSCRRGAQVVRWVKRTVARWRQMEEYSHLVFWAVPYNRDSLKYFRLKMFKVCGFKPTDIHWCDYCDIYYQ